MASNLHDIRSRSGENAQMTRTERLPGITPPLHIAAESHAGGVFGAFKRVFAAAFAASVFTCAAGVGWIDERAATTGRTGSWSESVAYDSVMHAAAICDNVFTLRSEMSACKSVWSHEMRKETTELQGLQAARRVNAVYEINPENAAAAAAIGKVAALVEEYKLVASQSKGKKKEDPEPEPAPEAAK